MEKKFRDWQCSFGINDHQNDPSYFLQSLAEANIIGVITDEEAERLLKKHLYEQNLLHLYANDLVILKIKRLLAIDNFSLDINFFFAIHKYIFSGIMPDNGVQRSFPISRKEPCLENHTVVYASPNDIFRNLNYDFNLEKSHNYQNQDYNYIVNNLANFVSNIWQAHPFSDGNTRTTSVFLEKYLRNLGFTTNNNIFKDNSIYFRNALVRSNPTTYPGLHATNEYLIKFFDKLLIDNSINLDPNETYLSLTR